MYRLKLVGLLAFLAVGLSLGSYLLVRKEVGTQLGQGMVTDLRRAQEHLGALRFAQSRRLVKLADWLAGHQEIGFAAALGEGTEQTRHQRAFAAVQAVKPFLRRAKRAKYIPSVVLVTDTRRKVLARDRFPDAWGQILKHRLLERTLGQRARDKDVWKYRQQNVRMMTAVSAPIFRGAEVVGALVLLYEHGNQMAAEDRALLRLEGHFHPEVAYYLEGKIYGSSLGRPEEVGKLQGFLQPYLPDLGKGEPAGPHPLRIGGHRYLAIAAPMDDNVSQRNSGYLVLGSLDEATAPVGAFAARLPFIAGGLFIVTAVLGLLMLRSLTSGYDKIEHGVMEIVAGNGEYRFDSSLPGGAGSLAQGLNLLNAQLLGRPPPDREVTGHPWADPFFVSELSPEELQPHLYDPVGEHRGDLDSGLGLTLSYYEALHREYLAALAATGSAGAKQVSLEEFVGKVRHHEETLKRKYACPVVKFEVRHRDGQVTLHPLPIR